MSTDNADIDNAVRSRSLLRQVRETIGGINRTKLRTDKTADSYSLAYHFNKRGSLESPRMNKKSTPNLLTNHFSYIKSHINKVRKPQDSFVSQSFAFFSIKSNSSCLFPVSSDKYLPV